MRADSSGFEAASGPIFFDSRIMKLRVLGCSGGSVRGSYLSSFLFEDRVSLDAGGLTNALTLEEQRAIGHVIVSHTHLDHNCGLPFFLDNVFDQLSEPVVVYGTAAVIASLKAHMFNDELWPDFTKLPSVEAPTMRFQDIEAEKSFVIDGLTFTPIEVEHLTPTVGFLVEDKDSAVLYTSDTGPTDRVWQRANAQSNLKAVITEISFSNTSGKLAHASGHMTPDILAGELSKLTEKVPVFVTHTKPGHLPTIRQELARLNLKHVELIEQGKVYHF